MALEALNDAGCSQTRLTVILNDNEMSISKNEDMEELPPMLGDSLN